MPDRDVIYLVALAGNPNFGDEFITRAWLRRLARVRPDADVVVDCPNPGQAAVLHHPTHPRVRFVDTVWRICAEVRERPTAEAVDFARRVVAEPGLLCRCVDGIELLGRAQTVHVIGGGYLNAVWPQHLPALAAAVAAAQRSGARLVATGQGLAPGGDDEWAELIRSLARACEIFDVRDTPSWELLGDSVSTRSFTGDDAWLGIRDHGVYDAETEAARRRYVLCLQTDLVEDFAGGRGVDGLVALVGDLIERWRIRGDEVAVVEGIPGVDRIVYDRLGPLLDGAHFTPFTDLWRWGLPARHGQVWISTRFHPHLLAAAAGVSGLAVSGRADYYPVKHRSLQEAGSRWSLLDGATTESELPIRPPDSGGFERRDVERLRRGKRELAERIYPRWSSRIRRGVRRSQGA
ncbi:polysaccharide pyruvyl transferase family protein [Rhodococcus sp. D2-41]|uniref:Polysaccharide pyruvyl transferase family protein n=1 Tax=Speluncibacter jeojiensis TaxID=2710754 RepID=A0A9X4M6F9_9ACTN|nr:polysaccharide pyruvyl transferase family protein [Rhodococcus sp. D2-41]MDG3012552.1 polysaccharide pyruvyl transferase family protein [Rhodococcus sp. D2-41]MDG3015331.1 polysaccharide pyruvyl transferase family protein [Corynebacteriales bacterium D3-21]